MKRTLLKGVLLGLAVAMRITARRSPGFRKRLGERDLVAQIRLKDGSVGRHYHLKGGRLHSAGGLHPRPDVSILFHDIATALAFMKPRADRALVVHAAKHFKVAVQGADPLVVWFMQLLNCLQTATLKAGTPMRDGSTRFTTCIPTSACSIR